MRVRIRLLPREFSTLWRAICARWRRRGRDLRDGHTNVVQARAPATLDDDRARLVVADHGARRILSSSVEIKDACTQIDRPSRSHTDQVDRRGQLFTLDDPSRPELLQAFAFYVRSPVTSGALRELDESPDRRTLDPRSAMAVVHLKSRTTSRWLAHNVTHRSH